MDGLAEDVLQAARNLRSLVKANAQLAALGVQLGDPAGQSQRFSDAVDKVIETIDAYDASLIF